MLKTEQTVPDGFVVSGFTNRYGAGAIDFYLIKTAPDGNIVWSGTTGERQSRPVSTSTGSEMLVLKQSRMAGDCLISGHPPTSFDISLEKTI